MNNTQPTRFIAHVRDDGHGAFVIHDLDEHLRGVARLAEEFARDFGSADWARVAGVWHDLGKYSKEFQWHIKSVSGYDPDAYFQGLVRLTVRLDTAEWEVVRSPTVI